MGYSSFKYAIRGRGYGGDPDRIILMLIIAACALWLTILSTSEDNALKHEKDSCTKQGMKYNEVTTRGAMGIHHSHIVCVPNPDATTQKDLQDYLLYISTL